MSKYPLTHAELADVMQNMVPFNRHLGIVVDEIRHGFARFRMPFREELLGDPVRRVLHGGTISALVDVVGGTAVWSTLEETGSRVATIDFRVDYLRPGRDKDVVAEAAVVRVGNRVGVTDTRVFQVDRPDKTIATGKGVYNILRGRVAE